MEIGKFIQQSQGYKAFIPAKFPPEEEINFPHLTELLHSRAAFALGKLDGITQLLPDLDLFIRMYARKEAALSSEIEGTQATMSDSLRAEIEITKDLPKDVDRILHYIEAMSQGLKRLDSLPLASRLIQEVHKILIENTGDAPGKTPGEFRRSQNWIGGASPSTARFVPPPIDEMQRSLGDLEKFIHSTTEMPVLIKAALIHAQFETIHPFLDGNGRVGRLLITFYLCQQGVLERPVLYLSAFFKKHRETYFDMLESYHNKGDVVSWVNFFLEGIEDVAKQAVQVSRSINALREEDMVKLQLLGGSRAKNGLLVLRELYKQPIVNVRRVETWTGLSRPAANTLVKELVRVGILIQRNRRTTYGRDFEYKKYLELFSRE